MPILIKPAAMTGAISLAIILALTSPAHAQVQAGGIPNIPSAYFSGGTGAINPFGPGYSPYSPYMFGADPYGGYLNGAANVINAQGQYLMNTQQAYQMQQQATQSAVDTRRKAYDEYLYEQQNKPTLNETLEKQRQQEVRRSLNSAPITEVWSGKALNDLLGHIQALANRGSISPTDVPISPDLVRHINVTTGKGGTATTGALRQAGNLSWPYGLEILNPAEDVDSLRKQIDSELSSAKSQTASGKPDARLLKQLSTDINTMRSMLVAQVAEYTPTDYITAKRFLSELDDTVATLKSADARSYVDGKFQAQGNSVRDLVRYMTDNGLTFAPATAGGETSYTTLHNAMVQYDIAAGGLPPSRN